ncbi:MAG: alpha/beta hydrolase [Chloroflexota bacterium]|nr:MAG: alpha/beta hydrolase [Chloroflexota bacterium]
MTNPTPQPSFIRLPDGRQLAYAEYGDPQGKPVIYFHGNPSSRLEPLMFGSHLDQAAGLRVIAADRPGMGRSDFQPGRKLTGWPADVCALADSLHLDRFAVLGISAGGPYVSVCARMIPERLTVAGILSGVGPMNTPGGTKGMGMGRYYFRGAAIHPWLAELFVRMMRSSMSGTPRSGGGAPPGMPPADIEALAQPELGKAFLASAVEAWSCGARGTAWDATLLARPWGFNLTDIQMPVYLWHGEADTNAPVAMGRFVAQSIPDCRAKFYPNEGHISVGVRYMDEILSVLK